MTTEAIATCLKDLLEIARVKCGPNDEIIDTVGRRNHDVMVEACNLLGLASGAPAKPLSPIVVKIGGGGLLDVTNMPRGVRLEVHDYDVGGSTADNETYFADDQGAVYSRFVF